ncbi:MAG: DNA-3-methyladenine glycosylase I [Sphingobacteriaceae bacterium]
MASTSVLSNKEQTRCSWCGEDLLYTKYHDEEWGKVVHDDHILFEFLILEAAQAGLSWITILRKRENYRNAFSNFDPVCISQFGEDDVGRLMQDGGIIRNRLKIHSAISNARCFLKMQQDFGSFDAYLYHFMPDDKPISNHWENVKQIPVRTAISDAISNDMKRYGFKFFGTTICYAYMQATGMVNDHLEKCTYR